MRPRPVRLLDHREFPLLYVDDEPENLRIFELTFRREFSILTAKSADEGMRVLNENPIAVVLSDHRMPGMTGVEFLSRVRELDEKTIRILVTAYGDADILSGAINDGRIYRYVPKPWDRDDMRLTLLRAIEMYAVDRERDALVDELTRLNQLSRALHCETDLDRLLALLLETAHHQLGFDGAALLFFDSDDTRLTWRGVTPDNEVASRLRSIAITNETAPRFLDRVRKREMQALRIDEASDLELPIREWITEVSADETLVVPLVGKQNVIGVLAVDNRSGGRHVGADERTLLDGVGMLAVSAIENARLIDDLRRSREQVQRADRLGTLGTLAAGLAHEINNPLTSIHTFLSLAPQKRGQDDEEFWENYHRLACSELERIRELVATMLHLPGGGEVAEPEQVDLAQLASEVVKLLHSEIRAAGVELTVESQPETSAVLAVRSQIHQLLLNLLLNALHASPEGGRVRLTVAPDPERSDCLILSIEDSGPGIAEEDLERIFDPFFTTKGPDKGTGLGLMIAHQIVANHGGSIEVRSRLGNGTTFHVRLPMQGA